MANRYCGNCGSELSQDVRFCPSCGRPVHQTAQVSTPEADVDVPQPAGGWRTGSQAVPGAQQSQQGEQRRGRPILKGCLGIVVVLFLLAVIGALLGDGGGSGTAGGGNDSGGGNGQQAQDSSEGQESASSGDSGSSSGGAPDQGTIPGDGTFIVGEDIQPGTYETEGGGSCYWERLSGTSGDFNDIITNGLPTGPATITISPSDEAFLTEGCSEWTLR